MDQSKPICLLGSTGDVGSQLLRHLNDRGFKTLCPVRLASPLIDDLRFPGANRFVRFPEAQQLYRRSIEFSSKCSVLINCSGLNRPLGTVAKQLKRDLVYINCIVPILVSAACEEAQVPCIHISTGDLDANSSNAVASFALLDQIADLQEISGARLAADAVWKFFDRIVKAGSAEPYVFSKLLQETYVRRTIYSKSVRLSNFYGPGYIGLRLVPRLISNRIRGERLHMSNEERNYIYKEKLNMFMTLLAMKFFEVSESIVWCYGETIKTVQEISCEIERQLPACYGDLILEPTQDVRRCWNQVKRVDSYFPELSAERNSFQRNLSTTIEFWRRRFDYRFPVVRKWRSRIGDRGTFQLNKGGSIATKLIHSKANRGRGILEKSASQTGYEGAGAPKLRSELRYYLALREDPRRAALLARYVRLIRFEETNKKVSLFFDYSSGGKTVADYVLAGGSFPHADLCGLVRDIFLAGYLTDLRKIEKNDTVGNLEYFYVNRALDRTLHFISHYDHSRAPKPIKELFQRIESNDVISIDSIECRSPLYWLNKVRQSPTLAMKLSPRVEGFCSHGDLTILNILMNPRTRSLTLIDPRGHIGFWDPVYDLSKLTFSLSGFSHVILGQFAYSGNNGKFALFPCMVPDSFLVCLKARKKFLKWIREAKPFLPLRNIEPNLLDRIRFAEAVHYLADAPFRFAIGHEYHDVGAVLLLGTKYLEHAMRALIDTSSD